MSTAEILTLLGVAAILREIIVWLLNRKKLTSEVRLSNLTEVQEKIAILEKIISRLENENNRLEEDQQKAEERERAYRQRIRELEDEVESIRKNARETERKCDNLSAMIERFERELNDRQSNT